MASSHLLRVLRPTCNYRQIYLSRTLPLYTGVFHRHFFSDTPIRSSQLSSASEVVKPRRTRSKNGQAKSRRKVPQLTVEDEAAMNESKLDLPPIDKWRQYFAIMEGQRLRFFLRNPDTARMLAEAFIPKGSKDLIVIEAAAGMYGCFFL